MKKETLNKANNLMKRINDINWQLEQLDQNNTLSICSQYSSGNYRRICAIDDCTREFMKKNLIEEKERLEKELERL